MTKTPHFSDTSKLIDRTNIFHINIFIFSIDKKNILYFSSQFYTGYPYLLFSKSFMKEKIVKNLVDLTYGNNNDVKIAAITALGDYKCSIEQQDAIDRLLVLCDDYNKDIAVASIISLSKLAKFFYEKQ